MKFYALNGSPRIKWNDDQLLDSFSKGIRSVDPDAEITKLNLYQLNYKGCRSCFGCKLKKNAEHDCVIRDDIHDILIDIRKHSDGFVLASPIYFLDITGEARCFLERLMYPGPTAYELPVATIFTMNAEKATFEKMIRPCIDILYMYFKANFHTEVEQEVTAHDTLQRNHNELYIAGHTDHEAKARRHETQWPIDLKNAFEAGAAYAKKAKAKKAEREETNA